MSRGYSLRRYCCRSDLIYHSRSNFCNSCANFLFRGKLWYTAPINGKGVIHLKKHSAFSNEFWLLKRLVRYEKCFPLLLAALIAANLLLPL